MNMVAKDLIYLNEATNKVYDKHITGSNYIKPYKKKNTNSLDGELVDTIRCLLVYGASQASIDRWYDLPQGTSCHCINRKTYRYFVSSFQLPIIKKLGNMYFKYDEQKIKQFYDGLSDDLKALTIGEIIEDRMIVKSKVCKQDY